MEPILDIRKITKKFGGLIAVDHVDFQIFPGEVVGLLGDNGAGKSTLIKMIAGVYHPTGGQIFFQGKEVTFQNPMEALDVGIETIYQDLALAENLNVYSNIFLGREKLKKFLGIVDVLDHDYMHTESQKALNRLGIHIPSLRNNIATLSGGQRQAVAICRSIYRDAKLLMMDEPTTALGVAEQRNVWDLVRVLKAQNVPIIISSYQMRDVFSVTDRIVVMRRGQKAGERIVRNTSPDEVVGLIVGAVEN